MADGGSDGQKQRSRARVYWVCAVLTAAVAGFLVADVAVSAGTYQALAWVGVSLSALSMLTLIVWYAGCALGRLQLDQRPIAKVTLFQLSTVPLLIAVAADILIPSRDTGGLALLLPWGITYWLYHLRPTT